MKKELKEAALKAKGEDATAKLGDNYNSVVKNYVYELVKSDERLAQERKARRTIKARAKKDHLPAWLLEQLTKEYQMEQAVRIERESQMQAGRKAMGMTMTMDFTANKDASNAAELDADSEAA